MSVVVTGAAIYGADVNVVAISKRLSFILRHHPESVGLNLDPAGWARVDDLLSALAAHGFALTRGQLEEVVRSNDKQRFAFDESGQLIRASQGHSVSVELGYAAQSPPAVLFHGTPTRNLAVIQQHGLQRRGRHAVHLSPDRATARIVGARRGRYVVLRVDAAGMANAGWSFTRSANGVWLVPAVPSQFLAVDSDPDAV